MSWLGLELNRLTEARNESLMNLSTALKERKVILLDGAIGTELGKHGLMGRARPNLDNPEVVLNITPGTVGIYRQCLREGLIEIFMEAEATVPPPACGM